MRRKTVQFLKVRWLILISALVFTVFGCGGDDEPGESPIAPDISITTDDESENFPTIEISPGETREVVIRVGERFILNGPQFLNPQEIEYLGDSFQQGIQIELEVRVTSHLLSFGTEVFFSIAGYPLHPGVWELAIFSLTVTRAPRLGRVINVIIRGFEPVKLEPPKLPTRF